MAVFIDYWWVYSSARQLFGGAQPQAWFGNVAPVELARMLVKHPPASVRRSDRVSAGVHIFIRSYDPAVHHGQHERVQRWTAAGARVDVGPSRETGGPFWQSSVSVAMATAVTEALATGACDTAVVFAGDAALLPLFTRLAGTEAAVSSRIELATWVGRDGTVPTTLASVPGVWCHRLGEQSFKQASDDRRPARPGGTRQRHPAAGAHPPSGSGNHRKPPPASTAMAAAFAAAGLPGAVRGRPPVEEPARPAMVAIDGASPTPVPRRDAAGAGVMRRLTQRLFGRGA